MRPWLPPCVAVLLVLLVAGPAAAGGFVTDENLAPGVNVETARVAMASDGRAAAVWVETLPSGMSGVRVASREPGAAWVTSAALDVSARSKQQVGVAVNASGALVATWEQVTPPSTYDVAVVSRAPGGALTPVQQLTMAGAQTIYPAVGLDATGRATLTYTRSSVRSAIDFPAGGSAPTATPATVTANCIIVNAFVVAPNGDAAAALDCGGARFAVRRGGTWGLSPFLASTTSGTCNSPDDLITRVENSARAVVVDGSGRFDGLLERETVTGKCASIGSKQVSGELRVATEQNGALVVAGGAALATGASMDTDAGAAFSGPVLGVAPEGLLVVYGDALGTAPFRPLLRTTDPTGNSGPPAAPLAGPSSSRTVRPVLGSGPGGHALVTWDVLDAPAARQRIVGAARPPGGLFGEGQPVSNVPADSSFPLTPGVDAAGNGLAAYLTLPTGGAPRAFHVRGYDAVAPELSSVSIAATATAGSPVNFGAQASDLFGPVSFSWDFGDGGSAAGAAPSHTFSAPGPRTVTVTATDAAGNASTRSGTVGVAAAPGGTTASGGAPATGGLGAVVAAPVLSKVALDRTRFRVGPRSTALAARARKRAPAGATLSYTLDRAATVTIAVARTTTGRRSRSGCVKATAKNRKAKSCTRQVAVRTLRRASKVGATRVAFSGRFAGKALPVGTYTLTLVATAGGRSGRPLTVTLHIVG